MPKEAAGMDFNALVSFIGKVHEHFAASASKAVNVNLTLRNWLIGAYIAEYELIGEDRAVYGEGLLSELASSLETKKVSSCGRRQLYNYLRFYRTYPGIVRSLPAQLRERLPCSLNPKKVRSVTAQLGIEPETLIGQLSYTHIEQLAAIEDSLKRTFYEIECIQGNWSVRELKRQMNSLFVSRYQLELPSTEEMKRFLQENIQIRERTN